MDIPSFARGGMHAPRARLENTAKRLAPAHADTVELSAEAVALLEARIQFAANARAADAGDEMQERVIEILG
jgi:hypothetical protein